MVRRKKIATETDNSNWQAPKKRKPRKSMSEEQKKAAAERLKKAREARAEKNPDYGLSGVHESIRDLPDEHPIAPKKVKQWIKTQKELASVERSAARQNIKGALARQLYHEGYIKSMQTYLRTGDWIDIFYGEHQQNKIRWRSVALAYDADGIPKRNVGTFYPDMGCVYTQEIYNEEKGISDVGSTKRKRRGKQKHNTGPVAKVKKKG
jgi:hypothetical protein